MSLEQHGSPESVSAYLGYLAEIGDQQKVIATETIQDKSGNTLIKAGECFSSELLPYFDDVLFSKPIDECLKLEELMSVESLSARVFNFVESEPSMAELAKGYDNREELIHCCEFTLSFPILCQKLTVLSVCLPRIFEQGLFSAWFGVLVMSDIQRSASDTRTIFCSALSHDIGMLSIDAKIVRRRNNLNAEEWRLIQQHPTIGYEILRDIDDLPKEIPHAVWEHHENLDGTGYPRGVVGSMISRQGQLLGLLDCMNKVYAKRFRRGGRSIRDLIPFIRMNGHARFGNSGKKFIEVLSVLPETNEYSVADEQMSGFLKALRDRNDYVMACVAVLRELATDIGFRHNEPAVFVLQNAILHISVSVTQTGTINPAYMRWIDQVEAELLSHAYKEAEDAFLMLQEVLYHLDKLKQQMRYYLDNFEDSGGVVEALQTGLNRLEDVHKPEIDESIKDLWLVNVG